MARGRRQVRHCVRPYDAVNVALLLVTLQALLLTETAKRAPLSARVVGGVVANHALRRDPQSCLERIHKIARAYGLTDTVNNPKQFI